MITLEKPAGLIWGVALVIVNPEGKILILQEFTEKHWLGKYMYNFAIPMETRFGGEWFLETLLGLAKEELPGLTIDLPGNLIGQYQIVSDVWARLYVTKTDSFDLPVVPSTKEVGNYRWMPPSLARKLWLRQGAAEMIGDYAAGYRHTNRQKCAEVRPYAMAA